MGRSKKGTHPKTVDPRFQMKLNERRASVYDLWKRGYSAKRISIILEIKERTASHDISFIKDKCNDWLFDIAKYGIAADYHMICENLKDVMIEAWRIVKATNLKWVEESQTFEPVENPYDVVNMGARMEALKLYKDAQEAYFKILNEGPTAMVVKDLNRQLEEIKRQVKQGPAREEYNEQRPPV